MIKTKKKTNEKAIPIIEQTARAVRLFSALKSLNTVRKVTKAINVNIADQKRVPDFHFFADLLESSLLLLTELPEKLRLNKSAKKLIPSKKSKGIFSICYPICALFSFLHTFRTAKI